MKKKFGISKIILQGCFILAIPHLTLAANEKNKSQYTIFNPTPNSLLREFNTDRPDKTESPYTVDAGHFQIETDLITYTQDKSLDYDIETRIKSYSVMVSNLKVGLTNTTDLQLILSPYQNEKTDTTNIETIRRSGFGDTILRLKHNLFGNDGGNIALGMMPFIKWPTNSDNLGNNQIEYGLILPIALELPKDWSLGMMAQANLNKNEIDNNYHVEYISSATIGRDIVGNLAGYIEFFSQSSAEPNTGWIATGDLGLTYRPVPNVQLDAGVNIGLTKAADDFNPFLGISARC